MTEAMIAVTSCLGDVLDIAYRESCRLGLTAAGPGATSMTEAILAVASGLGDTVDIAFDDFRRWGSTTASPGSASVAESIFAATSDLSEIVDIAFREFRRWGSPTASPGSTSVAEPIHAATSGLGETGKVGVCDAWVSILPLDCFTCSGFATDPEVGETSRLAPAMRTVLWDTREVEACREVRIA